MRALLSSSLVLALAAPALADNGPSDFAKLDPARSGTLLRSGASGSEVTALQNALAGVTHAVPLTGKFDAAIVAASNLPVSGTACVTPASAFWSAVTSEPLAPERRSVPERAGSSFAKSDGPLSARAGAARARTRLDERRARMERAPCRP